MPEIIWASELRIYFTYMWNLKYDRNEPTYKTEITHRHREQTCGCQQQWVGGQGEVMGEMEWEVRLADANYYIQNGKTTRSYCIAQ